MYHSAFVIILSIFECVRWISYKWDLLAVPQSSIPYVHFGFIIALYIAILLCNSIFECFPSSQLSCCFHVSFEPIVSPRYLAYGCNSIWLSLILIAKIVGCRVYYLLSFVFIYLYTPSLKPG